MRIKAEYRVLGRESSPQLIWITSFLSSVSFSGPSPKLTPRFASPQESKSSGRSSMSRCRNSVSTTTSDEQPHIGNYRLLKTIGKGNFAKVKLARHVLTGKEVSERVWP